MCGELSYATVVGVRWCVLTNGDEYRIYNSHAAVDVEQKLFRSVRTSDTANVNYVTDTLLEFFPDHKVGMIMYKGRGTIVDQQTLERAVEPIA